MAYKYTNKKLISTALTNKQFIVSLLGRTHFKTIDLKISRTMCEISIELNLEEAEKLSIELSNMINQLRNG